MLHFLAFAHLSLLSAAYLLGPAPPWLLPQSPPYAPYMPAINFTIHSPRMLGPGPSTGFGPLGPPDTPFDQSLIPFPPNPHFPNSFPPFPEPSPNFPLPGFGNGVDSSPQWFLHPELASSINRRLDPCDNFYEFVCSGWKARQRLQDWEISRTQTDVLRERTRDEVKALLVERNDFEPTHSRDLMVTFYMKCARDFVPEQQSRPVLSALRTLRDNHTTSVTDMLIYFFPRTFLYNFDVQPDVFNSSANVIHIIPASTLVADSLYAPNATTEQTAGLRNFLNRLLSNIAEDDGSSEFYNKSQALIDRKIASFYRVEQAMAQIHADVSYQNGSEMVEAVSFSRLVELAPSLHDKDAIKKLENLTKSLDNQTLHDYAEWKILISNIEYLDDRYQRAIQDLEFVLYGNSQRQSRETRCLDSIIEIFGDVLSQLYVIENFSRQKEKNVRRVAHDIREEFRAMLQENSWMDNATKEAALRKVDAINDFVGYDPFLFVTNFVESRYTTLNYTSNTNYMTMMDEVLNWMALSRFDLLTQANYRTSLDFSAPVVNAFYDGMSNQIGAFFNETFPRTMNLAAIGSVIGHEITHGFDQTGARIDEYGNFRNWWANDSFENFNNAKQCMISEYSSYTIDGVAVNGQQTLDENIADHGGIRAAIRAMQKALKEDPPFVFMGLEDFNMEQLFYVNYAFSKCGVMRQKALAEMITSDVHAPDEARTNVVLRNQPEFAKAFHCSTRSAMVNSKTCRVW